jgi:hypothetical protein
MRRVRFASSGSGSGRPDPDPARERPPGRLGRWWRRIAAAMTASAFAEQGDTETARRLADEDPHRRR